jgi:hypothetical protein
MVELQLPAAVTAGKHRAVIILLEGERDDPGAAAERPLPIELPVHDFGPWPTDLSLRREDL